MEQVVSSASSDPLLIPSGPITRARTKRFKEVLNGLIKDIWAKGSSRSLKSNFSFLGCCTFECGFAGFNSLFGSHHLGIIASF